jgi:putative protease
MAEFEKNRLELHLQAQKMEIGEGNDNKYQSKKQKYLSSLEEKLQILAPKTPRIGKEGCCGKGCNGCLIFWYDDKYHKARELLKTKKMGEML